MTPIQLRSVLIDPRRSRLVRSVHQRTNTVTEYPVYPRRSPTSIIGLSMVGLAVFGALVIGLAGWVL